MRWVEQRGSSKKIIDKDVNVNLLDSLVLSIFLLLINLVARALYEFFELVFASLSLLWSIPCELWRAMEASHRAILSRLFERRKRI